MSDYKDIARNVFNSLDIVAWATDAEGVILLMEGKALQPMGMTPGQFIGVNVLELYRDNPVTSAALKRALAGEPHVSHTFEAGRTVETQFTPMFDAAGALIGVAGLSIDVTERLAAQAEIERQTEALRRQAEQLAQAELAEARRQETIRAQALAIQELSTPLIPITDEILVMPLIGTMDSVRAKQVLQAILEGAAACRARWVILDITGVAVVDTAVANTILNAGQAARLLGSEVIVTGIRPEVAQTLVQLGADLGHITTRGTLQSGIAHALGKRSLSR
ncbi:MAG TPA: STAS domain-containing protein [Nannocystis sp.]